MVNMKQLQDKEKCLFKDKVKECVIVRKRDMVTNIILICFLQ